MVSIQLGQEVKDKVSGYTGIVTSRTTYLYSNDRSMLVKPKVLGSDGVLLTGQYFNEAQLEVVPDRINTGFNTQTKENK